MKTRVPAPFPSAAFWFRGPCPKIPNLSPPVRASFLRSPAAIGPAAKIFFGEQAACFKCHQIAGAGGRIGPDLSNLLYRDYTSVLRDITSPSAAINPDHLAYNVTLTDGDTTTGVILHDTPDQLTLGQATGQSVTIPKSHITSMKASPLSLMPEGLLQALTPSNKKISSPSSSPPRPKPTPKISSHKNSPTRPSRPPMRFHCSNRAALFSATQPPLPKHLTTIPHPRSFPHPRKTSHFQVTTL